MSRNAESHYSQIPHANISRAKFSRPFAEITTINEGDLVPIYLDEVLPGDSFQINQRSMIRMSTPLYPVMDNCYMDTFYFFVPARLCWDHWENLMGENTQSFWAPKVEYTTPKTKAPAGGWENGTIADYFGIPTKVQNIQVNSMPFRAYARIWNEWFRDENLQQPVTQHTDDATTNGVNTGTTLSDAEAGGLPLKVAKYHDYFTSALPSPQKGEAVEISLAGSWLPVGVGDYHEPIKKVSGTTTLTWENGADAMTRSYNLYAKQNGVNDNGLKNFETVAGAVITPTSADHPLYPTNLWAESTTAAISINDLRQAIALQHILEADARGGTRYTEILRSQFGVTSPDSRLQRSEYIGGNRTPININQVIQNSATSDVSPQGNAGAYSLTTGSTNIRTYSAVEHGYVIGLAAIRVEHSYQQGLARLWTRSDRFSYYHPMLANLGEQAILNQEIYCQGNSQDEEVFGYQEAWADYRYRTSLVTGEMRSNYAQTLDAWHYADKYTKLPKLSSDWIKEGTENIDRTLAVQKDNAHQFICNFYFENDWVRPMPVYSIPGLERI